jgi:hypothetical protein
VRQINEAASVLAFNKKKRTFENDIDDMNVKKVKKV